jgi:gluconokinase
VIGPCWSPATRPGIALGLTLGHSRGHVLQGFIEGTCFSLRANLEWLQHLSKPTNQLRVECGGIHSRIWLQLKADIVGQTIAHVQLEEPTALGAAFLGGVAVGLFRSHAAAGAAIQCTTEIFCPDPQRTSEYETLYQGTYRPLPRLLAQLHEHAESTTKVD